MDLLRCYVYVMVKVLQIQEPHSAYANVDTFYLSYVTLIQVYSTLLLFYSSTLLLFYSSTFLLFYSSTMEYIRQGVYEGKYVWTQTSLNSETSKLTQSHDALSYTECA